MIPGLFKPGNSKAIALKNSEAIDIDATTYSEKQKTKNKTKKPKKNASKFKDKIFHVTTEFSSVHKTLESARIPKYEHRIESFIIYLCLIYKYMRQVYMTRM